MTELAESNNTLFGGGTVITAVVAKHTESDTVQFESVNNSIVVLVDGDEIIDFSELSNQQFTNVTVSYKGNQTYAASLSTGVTITVQHSNNIISDLAVTLSDEYYEKVVGLLGQYNSNADDDLIPQNGNSSISINSTLEEIHYQFGMTCQQMIYILINQMVLFFVGIIDNPDDSLFTYNAINSWRTFYKPEYRPLFEATFNGTALQEKAIEVCKCIGSVCIAS